MIRHPAAIKAEEKRRAAGRFGLWLCQFRAHRDRDGIRSTVSKQQGNRTWGPFCDLCGVRVDERCESCGFLRDDLMREFQRGLLTFGAACGFVGVVFGYGIGRVV